MAEKEYISTFRKDMYYIARDPTTGEKVEVPVDKADLMIVFYTDDGQPKFSTEVMTHGAFRDRKGRLHFFEIEVN